MRLVWALLVAWCMFFATATWGTSDRIKRTGVSTAPAYHHPLRHRDVPATLEPFVECERVATTIPPSPRVVAEDAPWTFVHRAGEITTLARGPPPTLFGSFSISFS